jgi:hypothetical protein
MSGKKRKPSTCRCGREMDPRSKLCKTCSSATASEQKPAAICPCCKGPMSKHAKTCRACRDYGGQGYHLQGRPNWGTPTFNPEAIDPVWASEFRGFFFAEGSLQLDSGKGHGLPRPKGVIKLTYADRAVLDAIAARLGGVVLPIAAHVDQHGYHHKATVVWSLEGFARVEPLAELLLRGKLPSVKVAQAQLLLAYIRWRTAEVGAFPTAEDGATAQAYYRQMLDLHAFVEDENADEGA